ncbi:MAG: altronate dehydratase [Desulfobacteraceae bacterium]|nr:MAG: altronate dehydratase [Desulfobacteraceae bacterium]
MQTFMGFERPDGSVGIRNHVAVIPSVACANGVVAAIARAVPEAAPLYHGHGCGRAVEIGLHTRTLANLGRNPNVAAVLVVGLGCETIKAQTLAGEIALSGKPVAHFNIQEVGGSRRATARGIEIVLRLQSEAGRVQRGPCPLNRLIVGLECGGSDAFSGITANPGVGRVSDWLVDQGATVMLTESTEMIGTSHILQRRACDPKVAGDIADMVAGAEKLTRDLLGPMAAYVIAPGNMDGGMSSIREKSLGCIVKSGCRPISQVVAYGQVPTAKGVVLMDAPGYDTESITGLAAGGCQAMLFTTGRGNPLGHSLVPVIKVASTSQMYRRMEDDMDIDAGVILDGTPLEEVGNTITALLRRVLEGERTKAEVNRQEGIVCLPVFHPAF